MIRLITHFYCSISTPSLVFPTPHFPGLPPIFLTVPPIFLLRTLLLLSLFFLVFLRALFSGLFSLLFIPLISLVSSNLFLFKVSFLLITPISSLLFLSLYFLLLLTGLVSIFLLFFHEVTSCVLNLIILNLTLSIFLGLNLFLPLSFLLGSLTSLSIPLPLFAVMAFSLILPFLPILKFSLLLLLVFFHLRRIRQISSYLDDASLKIFVCSLVLFRLDYCNSLYFNLLKSTSYLLTKVFNSAACLVSHTSKFSYISSSLVDLNWLPLHFCSSFKICTLMYKISHSTSPSYLSNFLLPPKRAGLRSFTRSQLFIISLSHSYAKSAFPFLVHLSGTLFLLILNLLPILLSSKT